VVCITEMIPVNDMTRVAAFLKEHPTRLIGPNCPGLATPGAGIFVYFTEFTTQGWIDAIHAAVTDRNSISVISISYGNPEDDPHMAWTTMGVKLVDQVLQAAAAKGVTVCVPSGDDGSEEKEPSGAHVDFPASSPWVLAVGGTKLVAKGYHFPEVNLVGVVDADTMLHMPDFRSAERTVQLLLQAAGRAGRAQKAGEVLVQSAQPGHYAIQAVARGDYLRFARQELSYRRELGYPPLSTLVRAVFSGKDEPGVKKGAESMARAWRASIPAEHCEFLGPSPAMHHKLRGRYRYHLLAKVKDGARLEGILSKLGDFPAPAGTKVSINVDPYDLF